MQAGQRGGISFLIVDVCQITAFNARKWNTSMYSCRRLEKILQHGQQGRHRIAQERPFRCDPQYPG
jgi:hypothetical protein